MKHLELDRNLPIEFSPLSAHFGKYGSWQSSNLNSRAILLLNFKHYGLHIWMIVL